MKRIILLLFITFSIHGIVHSTTKTFSINFPLSSFVISECDSLTSISSSDFNLSYDDDSISPALPTICINILLKQNEDFSSFSYAFSNDTTWTGIRMSSCSLPEPMGMHSQRIARVANSSENASIEYNGVYMCGGYKIISFSIRPFSYDTFLSELQLFQHITLEVSTQDIPAITQTQYYNDYKREFVQDIVLNSNDLQDYSFENVQMSPSETRNCPVEYLIVTNNYLKPYFEKLANWKTQKGIKSMIITTEDIYLNYTENRNQTKIKHAIKDIWEQGHHQLKYVLLGGNSSVVPSQDCYVEYNIWNDNAGLCDLYYASLTELEWDKNNNGRWGEVADSVDLIPDIMLARFPVNSHDEAEMAINRLIDYELNYPVEKFSNSFLMAGAQVHDGGPKYNSSLGRYVSDAEKDADDIWETIVPKWSGRRFKLFDTYCDGGYSFSSNAFQEQLQNGHTFIEVITHGHSSGWVFGSGGTFNNLRAQTLNNNTYSVVVTTACYTNRFYNSSNLGKTMFCSPTANVIFYQGSGAYGWTTYSPAFDRKLFENLMTLSSHRFAEAVYTVKKNTPLHQLTNNTCNRWLQITECTLGDPETSIFINHPLEFSNNRLSFSNNTLHFNTEEDSCNVCIMSKNNFGQTYYNVIKNVNQIVENNLNDDYSVCVTKFGFKPQLATIYGSGYIQNEHIGNASIFGDAIKIGSHVTEDKEYGPVEFKDGFCVIKSTNGCSILGGTTVKKGASVEFCVN